MKNKYTKINNLSVSNILLDFVNNELLKDTKISPEIFWLKFDKAIHSLTPKNKELIKTRENLQKKQMNGIFKIKVMKLIQKSIKIF